MMTTRCGLILRGLFAILAATLTWCCSNVVAAAAEPSASPPTAKDVFFHIPHTHWEGAVFKTRDEYLDMGLPNIQRAIQLLNAHPNYRFVLDQACYVKPFLERFPEEEAAFRKLIEEGRLLIVGGTDVMCDVNMPGGESFVRQVLYGKGYFRKKLGVDVTVGWQLDTFGHHAQMPQLLKLGGYQSFWFFRGVADKNTPSEFLWEGIDGSRMPAFWLPHGYANTFDSPKDLPAFTQFFKSRFDALAPHAGGRGRVGLAGADVCQPEEHVPSLVEQFNRQADVPFELRLAVPTDFETLAANRSNRPVIGGELNPIFQGTYSSRIELKQRTREIERLLTTAEKFGVLLHWLAGPANDEVLWRAWEPALFNQAHDLMSGVMTDHVYDDTIRGYDFSKRLASDEVQSRWQYLAAEIDTRGEGVPIAVFNTLGWARSDIATVKVGIAESNVTALSLLGPDGRPVAAQILSSERSANGSLVQAEIAFVAKDVPSVGYAVYRLVPLRSSSDIAATAAKIDDEPVIENDDYRLEFDAKGGGVNRLFVKDGAWEALSAPGNIATQEEDRGDLWELYKPLDGGSRIAMKTQHKPPQPGKAAFSSEQAGTPGTVSRGPVFSEFKVARPIGAKSQFATIVRLYAGLRRLDIRSQILNQEPSVRYRVLFPTSIRDGQCIHEIPFGAIQRPASIEFPAQNWIDYGNGQKGVALLNRGLPGNNVSEGTMMLSLLRSTRIVAYGFGGGYEPGMSSDSGLELGKELTFDYAVVPHAGDWREAGIYRDGLEFNHPLLAFPMATHAGALPNRWGFVDIAAKNIVVSALKPGPDGAAVLRVYEAAGQATSAKVRLSAQVDSAEEVNLMEDPGSKLAVADNTLHLDFRPFEIKTIKLQLQPWQTRKTKESATSSSSPGPSAQTR